MRRLLRDGVAVRAMCRVPEKGKSLAEAGAEVVGGNIQDARCLGRYMDGIDTVFHAAAVGDGTAAYQYNVNVQGTRYLAAAAHNAQVERFVHISTVAVYGIAVDGPIYESYPQPSIPDYYYGQTKALGEKWLRSYSSQSGLPVVVVRPAMVYGPGAKFWSQQLYQLCARSMMPLLDAGRGNAHPVYIDDVVDLLVTCATHQEAPGHVFHAAPDPAGLTLDAATINLSPEAVTLLTLPAIALTMLTRLTGQPRDIIGLVKYLGNRATYRMDEAERRLGWQPAFSLDQGMALTEPWLKRLD